MPTAAPYTSASTSRSSGLWRISALSSSVQTIPARAHFIWLGARFPWVNLLAIRSAALRGGFAEVVLHHDSDLTTNEHHRRLVETPGVTLRRLVVEELFARCEPFAAGLRELFARLQTPQTRSDLLRFAILYANGGVYLDMDTVTVREFLPLLDGPSAFFGLERIVYPCDVLESKHAPTRLSAFGRSLLRDLLRRSPEGWRLFRRLERLYPLAANPAILASVAGCSFMRQLIARMLSIPRQQQPLPYVIGPHLLQRMVKLYAEPDLVVHAPEVFFPLGPEISEHWFRIGRKVDLDDVLSESTRLVHWYASVRTRDVAPKIDAAYVQKHAGRQLFSTLALPFL